MKNLPRHVAIIMDGNGRWAKDRGLQRYEGHAQGARAVRETVETAARLGVEYLTLYAFSVANWQRPRIEVEALMRLLARFAKQERAELRSLGIRVDVIGSLEDLPSTTRHAVEDLIRYTSSGDRMTLSLALSYGARQDVLEAARALAARVHAGMLLPEEIDESALRAQMSTSRLPDVDLLIRTGGEARVSDFLLIEAAYAELLFSPVMWPDFRPEHLLHAIDVYRGKERRFGLTSEQLGSGVIGREAVGVGPFDPADRVPSALERARAS
jgi:undecaprenyl diphosphate synthase